jgi:hypothetical protein
VVCGNSFVQTRTDARTCSSACRQKLYREAKNRRWISPLV